MQFLPQFFTLQELRDAAYFHSGFSGRIRGVTNSGWTQPGYRAGRDYGPAWRKWFGEEHSLAAYHRSRTSALRAAHGERHGYHPLFCHRAKTRKALDWRRVS